MKLLYSVTSPYARKVRIVAAEKKLELEIVPSDPWIINPELIAANPLGKVPALITDDGWSLFDSRVIVEYLDGLSPVHRLIPDGSRDRILIKRWEALADGLLDAALTARLESMRPDQNESSAKQIARQREKITVSVIEMSRGLGEGTFCAGNALSLADIAVGCALGYLDFRFPDIEWASAHPNLAKLNKKLSARASFKSTEPATK
ncbi:MAG: glutathione S-transferase [Betaproteobacteria bacterium]|nr:MAG: glutathione S-transferase [Betaproteobacteria bacterium]